MADAYAVKLREMVNKLNLTSEGDLNTSSYLESVTQLEKDWWDYRRAFGDMCDNESAFKAVGFPAEPGRPGVIDAFRKFMNAFQDIMLQTRSDKASQPVVQAYVPFIRTMVSAVDDSAPLCTETQDKQIVLPLQKCLDTPDFLGVRSSGNLEEGFGLHVLNAFIFFANAMYRSPDIADTMKSQGGDVILSKYSDSKVKILALRALVAQSYLVADPKGSELPINDDMLKFIWETVNRKSQRISSGVGDFTLYGLLVYLHQLIRCSDACGQGLVRCGFLDSLATIMGAPAGNGKDQSTPGEKRTCAKICWALTLLESCGVSNAKAMKAHPKIITSLESIKSIRDDLAKAAEGALWQIKVKSERPGTARSRPSTATAAAAQKAPSRPATAQAAERPATAQKDRPPSAKPAPTEAVEASGVKKMVMISYTSHWKPDLVKRISDELQKLGVKTWIYNNEMKGDMYDEMAEAIETSAAVLICYSNPYFNSDPCHAELNYAREQKKILIPVRLEQFTPRGWLGISISGKLYYDFVKADTDEEVFKTQTQKLADCCKAEFEKLGLK